MIVLTLLIGNSAGSLASGLARGLALAATTVGSALLQGSTVESFDVSHGYPSIQLSYLHCNTSWPIFQYLVFQDEHLDRPRHRMEWL